MLSGTRCPAVTVVAPRPTGCLPQRERMTEIREHVDDAITVEGGAEVDQAKAVLRNPKFL